MPWNIIGNSRAVCAIARGLTSENPPHAYLFTGPDRVGKATLALRLAQALNCANTVGAQRTAPLRPDDTPDVSPCLQCTPCARIASGLHADVQTVQLEINDDGEPKTAIAVDQIREVERSVALNPFEGRTRVVIIDPAHLLTDEAQNAFLKTLEEPPPHVVIALVATREERLLPTIHSRCRRVEFRPVTAAEIEGALAADGVEPDRAALLARLAGGHPGWALEMAREPRAFERRRAVLEAAHSIGALPIHKRMSLAEKMTEDFRSGREAMYSQLTDWAGWWRDVMLLQSGAEDGVANADMLDVLREDAALYTRPQVRSFVHAILAAVEHLRANVQPRPALELLVLEAPVPAQVKSTPRGSG